MTIKKRLRKITMTGEDIFLALSLVTTLGWENEQIIKITHSIKKLLVNNLFVSSKDFDSKLIPQPITSKILKMLDEVGFKQPVCAFILARQQIKKNY